jgi:hypothetical protein
MRVRTLRSLYPLCLLLLLLLAAGPQAAAQASQAVRSAVIAIARSSAEHPDTRMQDIIAESMKLELERSGFRVLSEAELRATAFPGGLPEFSRTVLLQELARKTDADFLLEAVFTSRDEELQMDFYLSDLYNREVLARVSRSRVVDILFDQSVVEALDELVPVMEERLAHLPPPEERRRTTPAQPPPPRVATPGGAAPPAGTPAAPPPKVPSAPPPVAGGAPREQAPQPADAAPAQQQPPASPPEEEAPGEQPPMIARGGLPGDPPGPTPQEPILGVGEGREAPPEAAARAPRVPGPERPQALPPPAEEPEAVTIARPADRAGRLRLSAGFAPFLPSGMAREYFDVGYFPSLSGSYSLGLLDGRLEVGLFLGAALFRADGNIPGINNVMYPIGLQLSFVVWRNDFLSAFAHLAGGPAIITVWPGKEGLSKTIPFALGGAGLGWRITGWLGLAAEISYLAAFEELFPIMGIVPSIYLTITP